MYLKLVAVGSEINLRPHQFCNLSTVVVRPEDTLEDLKRKTRQATILGTLQSTLTDFVYVNPEWKKNCEEERLLGVSLTGIMDHYILSNKDEIQDVGWLELLKQEAIETNKEWSEKLGINQSTAITCIKPEGTTSQLVGSSSGIHPAYSKYYLRSVRNDTKDPMTQVLQEAGIPWEEDVSNSSNIVFYFPMKAPEGAVTRDEVSAIDQLELWKLYQHSYTEHKVSMTCYVKDDEWLEVGAWVYKNFDDISGIAFLPWDNGTYKQAPFQELSEEEYNKWVDKMPESINWSRLAEIESEDNTVGIREFACVGDTCTI